MSLLGQWLKSRADRKKMLGRQNCLGLEPEALEKVCEPDGKPERYIDKLRKNKNARRMERFLR
jgi:hypothetical protein